MLYNSRGNLLLESKQISILFIGNSMTQDGIAYLPYILKTYYPEIDFKFYMWYMSGVRLSQQYNAFINNTKCEIFSIAENSSAWTNLNNQKTINNILTDYSFDIVCMQEYFTGRSNYTESDLVDWNNCQNYILLHYTKNPIEFITLFHAPSCNTPVDANFNLILHGNELILEKTIAQDMIPMGIAKYRALDTILDNLGDAGHLTVDGGHAQEGLPCLLQTLSVLCWLFDKLNINMSIYGFKLRMTTAIYNTINVPGPNLGTGLITGTEAENIVAQEVAIQSFKEGKKITINSYPN